MSVCHPSLRIDHAQPHTRVPADDEFAAGYQATRGTEAGAQEWMLVAEAAILATPTTRLLRCDTRNDRRICQTRSLILGFPDYKSIWVEPGDPSVLVIRLTAGFGNHDFGVNRARVQSWLEAIGLPPVLP